MTSIAENLDPVKPHEKKNAVKVNLAITKLVETVEKKVKAGHTDKDLEELKQLRELCGSEDPLMSVTACHGLVYLVKAYVSPLENTISALVASLFSVKSVTGVCSALTELLILELRCRAVAEPSYTCPYNTKNPLHPLVAVLKRRPQAWTEVLNNVSVICTHPDKQVQSQSLELVKPVLVYVLREATDLTESSRLKVFKVIINHYSDGEFLIEALASCLCWNNAKVLEAVEIVSLLSESALNSKHGLHVSLCCLALAGLVPRLLQAAVCPQPALRLLATLAQTAVNTHSTLLALLADSIPTCPAPYLEHLLVFIVEILHQNQSSLDCVWMCVSALMPWLASNPSHLHKALHSATLIVSHASGTNTSPSTTATLIGNPAVSAFISADPRLTQALHIARLSEILRTDKTATLDWLRCNSTIELDQTHLYVSALLISHPSTEVRLAALPAVVESQAPIASSHTLTLLLFHLPREKHPEINLALLRSLPRTAVDKNNVMGVVSTIEAIRRVNQLNSLLAVDLYCQLWENQERCFPQLMNILNQDVSCQDDPCVSHMLQANICKVICQAKPEMHGKELVAKVSDLLNRCSAPRDAAASALALDALIPLCRQDVVDILTIWRSLSPRFSKDKRPLVLCSLCELVSVAAVQKSTAGESDDTVCQILKWLWNIVATNKHTQVVDSALCALSKFRPDLMSLKMLPECFRRGVKIPPELVKTPADAARKPEDVLDYVPGECWVQVLSFVGRESASKAVAGWIKMEVASFRGAKLYQVDRQEPTSYGHLPAQSVVRGVTTSLQQLCKDASADDVNTINLCLVALLQPTPKPLPSLSWAFLQQLERLEDAELTKNIVRLTSKQSQISPLARKTTEAYISDCGNNKDKIEFLYSTLTDLCKGIPPTILRPFLERTLFSALKEKDYDHFSKMISSIKTTLKEEKIHDANRTMLHQVVKLLWEAIEPQSPVLSDYFSCVSELPVSVTESMTSTSTMWEVTSAQLQKAFHLRAYMALTPDTQNPLNWINEIIDAAASNIGEQPLAMQLVTEVMYKLRNHETAWPWLRELMGQSHLSSADNKGGLEFLVTVFMLCVDIISGFSSLAPGLQESKASLAQDTRTLRFPQAVVSLVIRFGDANTMVEWLNHMRCCESFPTNLTSTFQLAARNVSFLTR
ncbi:focadhesin [Macrosteles quadrilineatus]|uniref:focadhesin n=1 Tax=Macrosteles quadrilineatus TaxID=74068 RepID=UPI0023E19DFC|nr:focadhesin [Macrosteles quadrilineatus]